MHTDKLGYPAGRGFGLFDSTYSSLQARSLVFGPAIELDRPAQLRANRAAPSRRLAGVSPGLAWGVVEDAVLLFLWLSGLAAIVVTFAG